MSAVAESFYPSDPHDYAIILEDDIEVRRVSYFRNAVVASEDSEDNETLLPALVCQHARYPRYPQLNPTNHRCDTYNHMTLAMFKSQA